MTARRARQAGLAARGRGPRRRPLLRRRLPALRGWRPALPWALVVLLAAAVPLAAGPLEEVDRAVTQLSAFVRRTVPDQEGLGITVLPFTSDKRGRVLLGDRIRAELELNLAANYARTRVLPRAEGGSTYAVEGEIQSYPGTVRVICRITRPDGSLGGGSRVDLPASPELSALLAPPGPESGVDFPFGGQGLHSETPAAAEGGDPFEPDDAPGFEVELPAGEIQVYARTITPGDVDRFRLTMPREGTAVLEVGTDMELQLLLFREGENVPFEVRGNRSGESLRLEVPLEAGSYIVELLAYDFQAQGRYTLAADLTGRSNDRFEPDGGLESARPMLPGSRQDRVLLPGDEDWVELSFTLPGFYAVYTEGLQVDTQLEVFDENGVEIARDDDSGAQSNAYVPLFLGMHRAYARVTGKGDLATGAYALRFEKIAPPQVYPGSAPQELPGQASTGQTGPLVLQLRILRPGRYLIRASAGRSADALLLLLYSLPSMRPSGGQESMFALSSGDYLLVVGRAGDWSAGGSLCLAPEAEAAACRQRQQEGMTHGSADR